MTARERPWRPVSGPDFLRGWRVSWVMKTHVSPRIVQRRLFEQGAEIEAGAVLFQINPAPFKAEVDSAAAALQRAEATLVRARVQAERLAPLVQAEAVSRQVYDDAVAQREQAAADVAQARATLARRKLDLQFASVEAPITGRIDHGEHLVALMHSGDGRERQADAGQRAGDRAAAAAGVEAADQAAHRPQCRPGPSSRHVAGAAAGHLIARTPHLQGPLSGAALLFWPALVTLW